MIYDMKTLLRTIEADRKAECSLLVKNVQRQTIAICERLDKIIQQQQRETVAGLFVAVCSLAWRRITQKGAKK